MFGSLNVIFSSIVLDFSFLQFTIVKLYYNPLQMNKLLLLSLLLLLLLLLLLQWCILYVQETIHSKSGIYLLLLMRNRPSEPTMERCLLVTGQGTIR